MAGAKDESGKPAAKADAAPRFGIAEWYGHSFADIDAATRKAFATFEPDKKKRLKKVDRERIRVLEKQEASGALTDASRARLAALREKRKAESDTNKQCPFRGVGDDGICSKDGGVCSLRLYEKTPENVRPVTGERSAIRALCPIRFHEADVVSKWVGEVLLDTSSPEVAHEVGFLESEETTDSAGGEDVGRLDMILVRDNIPNGHPMEWCALEIQAVYFSGKEMPKDFRAIAADSSDGMIWPTETRRPDYRSSGPKRLMPQLQIKVPTLRRWGKKMAVVVDKPFFASMGKMMRVEDASNADIAWFVVDFEYVPDQKRFRIRRGEVVYTTLDEAVHGLTGGKPVSKNEFESRIRGKLSAA